MNSMTKIYNEILSDLDNNPIAFVPPKAMRQIPLQNKIKIAYGIDITTKQRSVYFEIKTDTQINKITLPSCKGMKMGICTIHGYGDSLYLYIEEQEETEDYIFDIIVDDIYNNLSALSNKEQTLTAILKVLTRWKTFFQNDSSITLSDIKQQGLMGELLFLSECIRKYGPIAVSFWSGCKEETHDFYFNNHAVEVKTTSTKEPYLFHVSSEYQLYLKDVDGLLFLKFFAFRKSNSSGETLPQRIEMIRTELESSGYYKKMFDESLIKYGYFDQLQNQYTTGYHVRESKQFKVDRDFPCITPEDLKKGISNVQYMVSVLQCQPYSITEDDMFSELKEDK